MYLPDGTAVPCISEKFHTTEVPFPLETDVIFVQNANTIGKHLTRNDFFITSPVITLMSEQLI
jgi:hypothetical protein